MSSPHTPVSSLDQNAQLQRTPLNALHRELDAKLVPFAGYEMPLQYALGIAKEHQHVRQSAGLFDVSHMGQARLQGPDYEAIARAIEVLVPADVLGLKPGRMRYTQLLNDNAGMIDDWMVMRSPDGQSLGIVANAARKRIDFDYVRARLPKDVELIEEPDLALLALQGPAAANVLKRIFSKVDGLAFMSGAPFAPKIGSVTITRSGYTGEDGFEISVPSAQAEALARMLLAEPEVLPIGLGARDSLRLEAGLCLYGQDMDEATSPVEASLTFSIGKRRKETGGFLGAERLLRELQTAPARQRVGLMLEGRAAARTGTQIADTSGAVIGVVTSGAYTPSAAASIAMGYVPPAFAKVNTRLHVIVRGQPITAHIVELPFVSHRYFRK